MVIKWLLFQIEQEESSLDVVIQDVCGVLFNFIKTNPLAWAPIISNVINYLSASFSNFFTSINVNIFSEFDCQAFKKCVIFFFSKWSLELLGHISCKYAHQCGLSPTSSLNELLQMWVTCRPTKALMEVATECFAAMYVLLPILPHILLVLSSCVLWKHKLSKTMWKHLYH